MVSGIEHQRSMQRTIPEMLHFVQIDCFFICLGWFLLLIHAMSVISFVPLTNTKDDEEHQVDDEFSQCGLHMEFSVPLCLLSLPGRPQS